MEHFLLSNARICYNELHGALAEQLRSGLQNRVDGCDSRTCLHVYFDWGIISPTCADGGIGRREGLKIP